MSSKNKVRKREDKFWVWYEDEKAIKNSPYPITGKYLFFSEDKAALEKIALEEIKNSDFYKAKIPTEEHKKGDEYVLCLYYKDDSRKHELAKKYKERGNIKYRYWKSNKATLEGEYSEEFLSQLNEKEKKKWTQSKLKEKEN